MRGLSAELTGGENDYPSVTCGDSSPDKGSLWVRRRKGERYMKATGIVRRVDDLGRIVIPKEIRRTLRIREGDPSYTTFTSFDFFIRGIVDFAERITGE